MAPDEILETKTIESEDTKLPRVKSGRKTPGPTSAKAKLGQESHKQKCKTEDLLESWYFTHI